MPKKQMQDSLDGLFLSDESELEGEKLTLRWIAVEKIPLLLWAENPKSHEIGQTWESIVANGFVDPAKWDTNLINIGGGQGALVYGNGRCEAVHWGYSQFKNGLWKGTVPRGINTDKEGNWYIQCKFGIDAKSEAQAIAFGIDHNVITLSGGDYGIDGIMAMFDEKKLAKTWERAVAGGAELVSMDKQDLDGLLEFLQEKPAANSDASEAQLNRAQEWQEKWDVQLGQVWEIGRHRLMAGDSYDPEHLERLVQGATIDLLNTDPPYGINIVKPNNGASAAAIGGSKPFGSTSKEKTIEAFGSTGSTDRKGEKAVAERNSPKERHAETGHVQHGAPSKNQWAKNHPEYLVMKGDNVGRVGPSNIVQSNVYPVIEGDDKPFDPAFLLNFAPIIVLWGANYYADKLPTSSGWIVWDKRENLARNNFADCEMAWTNQDKPARIFYHLWNGLHKGSQHGQRRVHPTEKPVALFAEIGNLLAPGGVWLDLFAGSGAQMVAAEQNGATCYAMEYEVLYVATILQRLADLGLEPKRIE